VKPEHELVEDAPRPPEVDDDAAADAQDEDPRDDGSMASRVHRWTPLPRT
jgi:hypothetical protein